MTELTEEDELVLTKIWKAEFIKDKYCSLCGNTGIIDTRNRKHIDTNEDFGRPSFCICPIGRATKRDRVTLSEDEFVV